MRSKWVLCLALVVGLMFGAVVFAQDATPEVTPGALTLGDVTGTNAANYYGQSVTIDGNVDELVNTRSFLLGGGGLNNPQVLVLNNSGHEFSIGLSKDAKVRVTGTIYPAYSQGGWDQISTITNTGAAEAGVSTIAISTPAPMTTEGAAALDTTMTTMEPMATEGGTDTAMTTMEPMATEGAMSSTEAAMTTMEPMATEGAVIGMDTTMAPAMTETPPMMPTSEFVGLDQYPLSILTNRFPDHTLLVINSVDDIEFLPNPSANVTATPTVSG